MFTRWRELAKIETSGQIVPPDAPERKKDLAWSLQEISSAGAYIVSGKTVTAVEGIVRTLAASGVSGDLHDELETEYDAAKEALTVIRGEAYRELGII